MASGNKIRFCGEDVSAENMQLIAETVKDCSGLSRTELAFTICELLNWRRPTGEAQNSVSFQIFQENPAFMGRRRFGRGSGRTVKCCRNP